MQFRTIIKILGQLVALFSITMVPPALVSLIYKDGGGVPFVLAFIFSVVIGLAAYYPNRHEHGDLKAREGFLIVVLFWLVLGTFAAVPLVFLQEPNLSLADSVFEAFSGLTTTGATVLTGIEYLPKSVLFYRQQLQWLGGMGIIVLAVAVLPMLGVGGMQLYRAETPGPVKDSKMTPRIADTAKHLWYIYVSLTIACTLAYWAAGMDWFDAICHAFSTIAIGGFSTYDASMGQFDSPVINFICVVFLLIAAINFSLHYAAVSSRSIRVYLRDPEFKVFLLIQLALVIVCFTVLSSNNIYADGDETLDRYVPSGISTTAGFATDNFGMAFVFTYSYLFKLYWWLCRFYWRRHESSTCVLTLFTRYSRAKSTCAS